MKKTMICIFALLLLLPGAHGLAQEYVLEDESNGYFVCEDFDGELSVKAKAIFGSLLREGDEPICGTMFLEHYRNTPGKTNRGAALLAVRREGKVLLMGADKENDGPWQAGVETDGFLPPDAQFEITCEPMGTKHVTYAHLAISIDDEVFALRTQSSGALYLYEYRRKEADGSEFVIDCYGSAFRCSRRENGSDTALHDPDGGLPTRLCAWTLDSFPRTAEEIGAWIAAHPADEPDNVGYTANVNLRERPTGKSKSWGRYSAKVKILGQQPGLEVPWYNVRVGNLDGWVSGVYMETQKNTRDYEWASSAYAVLQVCRAKKETALLQRPDGEQVKEIPEGTLLHVIEENDGWLHVILPRGEISWQTDWDGAYGFIRKADAAIGVSAADAIWKK